MSRLKGCSAAAGLVLVLSIASGGTAGATGPDWLTWGANGQGQLCDGTTTNRTTPVFPTLSPGSTVVSIAAGAQDTGFAVLSTGQAYGCGNNAQGQLGNGTTTASTSPVQAIFPPGTLITAVAAGQDHTLWLTSTGVVYASGLNTSGQLGDGTLVNKTTPVLVDLPPGTTVAAIDAGVNTSYALTAGGDVLSWGSDAGGALGNGAPATNSSAVVLVSLPGGTTAIGISMAGFHGLVVDSNGVAYAWGEGLNGANCNGSVANLLAPVTVSLPGGALAQSVGTGRNHSLFITTTGGVYGCGENNNGELGAGTNVPAVSSPVAMILPPGAVPVAVDGGDEHSLILTTAGKVLATGYNIAGQLGDGTTVAKNTPIASLVGAGTTLNLISAGASSSMAVGTFSLTGVPLGNIAIVGVSAAVVLGGVAAWCGVRRRRIAAAGIR